MKEDNLCEDCSKFLIEDLRRKVRLGILKRTDFKSK